MLRVYVLAGVGTERDINFMKWSRQQQGIAFAILAPLLYTLRAIAIKSAPPIKAEQVVFLRFLCDFILLAPLFYFSRKELSSERKPLYIMRAICVVFSLWCSVYGITHLLLIDALLLENTMALFIPIVLWIWHRHKISLSSWFILFLGFASLFFLLKPKLNLLHIASFASLTTGLLSAISTVSINTLSKTESPKAMLFYFNIFSGSVALAFCVFSWDGMPDISFTLAFWLPLFMNSLCSLTFQYSIIRAYSLISPHVVGCFAYFGILFSALFGYLFWNEPVDSLQIVGGGLLILSGLLMILENKRSALPERF
jgi:drug/metabolite transporter (DMT)-like permease